MRHRKGTRTSTKAELGTRHRDRGELATSKGTSPGNLHLAAPKSVRRRHHQQQNSYAPWPILLSSYPAIEEPSCLVLRPIQRVQRSWERKLEVLHKLRRIMRTKCHTHVTQRHACPRTTRSPLTQCDFLSEST